MKNFTARFWTCAPNARAFPPPKLPELAVVGRSNSGKSTLINTLVGQHSLARTAKTAGKTRAAVFFVVEERFVLVDLPGYGFAKVSKREQAGWARLVEDYLGSGRPVRGVLCLFDIRRAPDELDQSLLELLGRWRVPMLSIYTKADKLSRGQVDHRSRELDRMLASSHPGIPFSSQTRLGRDNLLAKLDQLVI